MSMEYLCTNGYKHCTMLDADAQLYEQYKFISTVYTYYHNYSEKFSPGKKTFLCKLPPSFCQIFIFSDVLGSDFVPQLEIGPSACILYLLLTGIIL